MDTFSIDYTRHTHSYGVFDATGTLIKDDFETNRDAELARLNLTFPDVIADCAAEPSDDTSDVSDDAPGDDCSEHGPYADDDCPKCDDICCAGVGPSCELCGGTHSLVACPDHRALIVGDRVLTPRLLAWLLMYRETLALDFLRDLTPALFNAQAVASVTWMQHCGSGTTVEEWTAGIRRKMSGESRLRRTYAECQAAGLVAA